MIKTKELWISLSHFILFYLEIKLCRVQIEGGNNPQSSELYHPFIITDEPVGGYSRLTDKQKEGVRILAGLEFSW